MNAPLAALPLEFQLLNDFQRDFPLRERPFAEIAARLGSDEATVLITLSRLREEGVVSRIGAVFAPHAIGASTLAALAVPAERLEEVAAIVSAYPGVNHNYEREHRFNLWFVATAADEQALAHLLGEIGEKTGLAPISLPLEEEYHIDLAFDLAQQEGNGKTPRPRRRCALRPTTPAERRLIAALQPGLPLVSRPYAAVAKASGWQEDELLAKIAAWLAEGCIKRFGVVVRHHELGYRANAMVVFDVPDALVDRVGERLAQEAGVTLCYRRRRHAEWPYNLYCMVHGKSRAEVMPVIARLERLAGCRAMPLFSLRRFKQCGARYVDGE